MPRPNLHQALEAWLAEYRDTAQDEIDRRVFMQARVIQTLADGEPISAETFASVTGLPREQTGPVFQSLAANGIEFDDKDRLVGAALSL